MSSPKYWMMKTDAEVFSFDDLRQQKTTHWDGVRNFKARNYMREMKCGDKVLFYHSNCKDKGVAGLAVVTREAYPDFFALDAKSKYFDARCSKEKNHWSMVDITWEQDLKLVSLSSIREVPALAGMQLVKMGNRLSVFPVTREEYMIIKKMGQ